MEDLKVRINHLGRARLSIYQVVTQRCHDFNLEMFPFDDQSCVTRYASWHYSAEELKVIPVHVEFAAQHLEKHSSWRIIDYSPGEYRGSVTRGEMRCSHTETFRDLRRGGGRRLAHLRRDSLPHYNTSRRQVLRGDGRRSHLHHYYHLPHGPVCPLQLDGRTPTESNPRSHHSTHYCRRTAYGDRRNAQEPRRNDYARSVP